MHSIGQTINRKSAVQGTTSIPAPGSGTPWSSVEVNQTIGLIPVRVTAEMWAYPACSTLKMHQAIDGLSRNSLIIHLLPPYRPLQSSLRHGRGHDFQLPAYKYKGKGIHKVYLYSALLWYFTLEALGHWSHSFTCNYTNACLYLVSVHQMAPPQTDSVADI